MKRHSLILAAAALLVGGGIAEAQQQYDSLGSPTPAPNQNVSPATTGAGSNAAGESVNRARSDMSGTSAMTGSGADKMPADGSDTGANTGLDAPNNNGGATPGGLSRD